jgi:hypothetical protein
MTSVRDRTPLVESGLRKHWTAAFVVGELVGFIPPAVTGATLTALEASDPALVAGLTAAGVLEGLALGVAQSRVLRRFAPTVDRRAWIRATAAAAGFAWLVGMGGGAVMGSEAVSRPVALVALVPAWCAGLLEMGALQWRVLRRVVPRSVRWVWVNAAAWLVGVMIPVTALSAVPNSWPVAVHALVGVAAALAMGATVGGITGGTLEHLLAERDPIRT